MASGEPGLEQPVKHQDPSIKAQTNSNDRKRKILNPRRRAFGIWHLGFRICLIIGAWFLVLPSEVLDQSNPGLRQSIQGEIQFHTTTATPQSSRRIAAY